MDEMHIREDLVYDKHTGALIGFANIGDINCHNVIVHLEQWQGDYLEASASPLCS